MLTHLYTIPKSSEIPDNLSWAQLIETAPDNSLTLFDRGLYSLGLLNAWQHKGQNRHWLIPLKKGAQYEVVEKLGKQDAQVRMTTSPQVQKK